MSRNFNINDFMANIRTKGVLKTNRFEMIIDSIGNTKLSQELAKTTALRCESVQFPGISFATNEGIMRLGYGPTESIPYVPAFDQFTATFILDSQARIYNLFHSWVNGIVNFDTSRALTNPGASNAQGAKAYELSYRNDYTCNIKINVFDENVIGDGPDAKEYWVLQAIAWHAYPKALPTIDFSADTAELVKITIPFAFTDFTVTHAPGRTDVVAGTRRDDVAALQGL